MTLQFSPSTGSLTRVGQPVPLPAPLSLAKGPRGTVYVASTAGSGRLFALSRDCGAQLHVVGSVPSYGRTPCHLTVWSGRWLLCANYSGGTVSMYQLDERGGLGPHHRVLSFGPRSKPHQTSVTPDGNWVLVCDLDADRVHALGWDEKSGTLARAVLAGGAVGPGSGPRNLTFLAGSDSDALLVEERASSVDWVKFSPLQGELRVVATARSTTVATTVPNYAGDIRRALGRRAAYVLNRGSDTVSLMVLDEPELVLETEVPTGGAWPMQLVTFATGLLIANRDSNSLDWLPTTPSGTPLNQSHKVLGVPRPTCLLADI